MAPHGIVGISRFLCTPPRRFAYRCGRSFCANAASCHLTICILLSARPSLPLRKDPRPQRQAQRLGVVLVFLLFCANAVSCRLWVSILLPACPSLPLRKDPRPQRQAQHLGVVLVFLLFCANAVSCRLWVCILLPARPSLPLRKDPRPQRQAQHLGVVPVFLLFCANAVSCRLWVSILLPAHPSLPLRKDPRPQRQAQRLGVVRVGECYVKTAVFLCKCCVMSLGNMYTIACAPFLAFAQRSTPTAASSTPRRRASGGVLRQNSGLFVQMPCHVAWQYVNYCLRALPCLCAKILAHSGKLNTSASCKWGSTASKQRSFCANISPRRLANYKLFRAGI